MNKIALDIFLGEQFYGTLRIPDQWGGVFVPTVEELSGIVVERLPLLAKENFKIKL